MPGQEGPRKNLGRSVGVRRENRSSDLGSRGRKTNQNHLVAGSLRKFPSGEGPSLNSVSLVKRMIRGLWGRNDLNPILKPFKGGESPPCMTEGGRDGMRGPRGPFFGNPELGGWDEQTPGLRVRFPGDAMSPHERFWGCSRQWERDGHGSGIRKECETTPQTEENYPLKI
ncbi:hypothetical protein JTE90_024652 [Oedothorax gibbosus]|uniref:Uncharacterized protein n=1 Tax=Oedothorax gibbosus TaxID=931172 RepID=A0AAV6TE74_9ARAC|nr:hypothetical protein JTE90_024652 [Oedothorax gibbosus]